MTNCKIEGLRVPASPKALHCRFKQKLDSLLGTGSTRSTDFNIIIIVCGG